MNIKPATAFPRDEVKGDEIRCLVIRPETSKAAHGGDEIVYRRSLEYLSKTVEVKVCELKSVSRARQYLELAKGTPPEATRYLGQENRDRVCEAIETTRPDVVCFFNEVTFPLLSVAKAACVPAVLAAHNVHSVVAGSDPDFRNRILKPLAVSFERKWYDDSEAELVCISRLDVEGLRRAGVKRRQIFVAPPGCPAPFALSYDAEVVSEIVLTGSYDWWRKRRDLEAFARGTPLPIKIFTFDKNARTVLGAQAIEPIPDPNWEASIRFGLITDRFLGGFKLKALEYVARNCIVLTACDISPEFVGLPGAELFVRKISGKEDLWAAILETCQTADLAKRFREFKAACVARFNWEHCLAPLREAVEAASLRNSETS